MRIDKLKEKKYLRYKISVHKNYMDSIKEILSNVDYENFIINEYEKVTKYKPDFYYYELKYFDPEIDDDLDKCFFEYKKEVFNNINNEIKDFYYVKDFNSMGFIIAMEDIFKQFYQLQNTIINKKYKEDKEIKKFTKFLKNKLTEIDNSQICNDIINFIINHNTNSHSIIYEGGNRYKSLDTEEWESFKKNLNIELKSLINKKAIKKTIKEEAEYHFSIFNFKDHKKKQQILNDNDYSNFINWITYYFENEYRIPIIDKPIHTNTTKGVLITTLKEFYLKMKYTPKMDKTYYNLIKSIFYDLKGMTNENIRKTKKPLDYKNYL